jgi:hypothetical protein
MNARSLLVPFGVLLLGNTGVAVAQYSVPSAAGVVSPYATAAPFQRPTVSPYVNLLGPNQGTISSYHTLVRPMIEQREAAARQSAIMNPLAQQLRRAQARKPVQTDERPGRAPKFLHYSHYYGEMRK